MEFVDGTCVLQAMQEDTLNEAGGTGEDAEGGDIWAAAVSVLGARGNWSAAGFGTVYGRAERTRSRQGSPPGGRREDGGG